MTGFVRKQARFSTPLKVFKNEKNYDSNQICTANETRQYYKGLGIPHSKLTQKNSIYPQFDIDTLLDQSFNAFQNDSFEEDQLKNFKIIDFQELVYKVCINEVED